MPVGSKSYTTVIQTKGTTKKKLTDSESLIISPEEINQMEAYFDINAAPLFNHFSHRNNKQKKHVKTCVFSDELMSNFDDALKPLKKDAKTATLDQDVDFDYKNETNTYEEEDVMDWNNYHRLSVIHEFMDKLEYDYPSLCTTGIIGQSREGRDIKILKISNSNASNARVWIDAGIHAREWIGPAVNTFIANHIAKNFDALPLSMRNKDWFFLPVANPDGYEYSHTKNRMWRKNKASTNNHLFGVDLNRNFSLGWGGKGSSNEPSHAFYRGPKPFSEPESTAIKNLFTNSGLVFKVYITLHSFGQVIIMPYAYSEKLAPDYITLLQGATVMSRAIYDTHGNIYKVGVSKDVLYHASGTSNDWSHGVMGIPFCYLIELRSKKHKFKLPEAEISETGSEILNCLTALMEFIEQYENPNHGKRCEFFVESDTSCHGNKPESEDCLTDKESYADLKGVTFSVPVPPVNFSREIDTRRVAPLTTDAQVWHIEFTNESERNFLKHLDTIDAINIWYEDNYSIDIMVDRSKAGLVATMLHGREMAFSIGVTNVKSLWEAEQGFYNVYLFGLSNNVTDTTMDWTHYHRLETIYAFMDNLAAEYPYLCSVSVIGRTVEARDLKMLKISDGRENNEGVWLDGAIHAREWISPAVVTYIANEIVRNFHDYPDSVTRKDWYILPVFNPDGYEYTHTTDRMWRKNRSVHGENYGVDLNRNWSTGWGNKGEEGSSKEPGNVFFRGPKPFSEQETKAVKHTILDSTTRFKVFLSLHSYGEAILFPWGYTSDPCPNYVTLLEGGAVVSKAIYETNNHLYKVGSTKDLMYYAAGTSVDWAYQVAKIPFSYMFELRGKKYKFLLPKEKIVPTSIEILNGVMRLLDYIDKSCPPDPSTT